MHRTLKRVLTSIACVILCVVFGVLAACGSSTGAPYIGENGNWFVNGEDTGVSATGPEGPKGDKGDKGDPGSSGTTDPGSDPTLDPWEESTIATSGSQSGYDNGGKFYLDYATLEEEQLAAKEVAETIAEEGDVLLKNANALPLGKDENRISVFGTGSYSLINGGAGSGAGTTGNNGIEYTGLIDSLEAVGMKINPALQNLYASYAGEDNEVPVEYYNKTITSTYNGYNDAAIITFSRQGAEDGDLAATNAEGHSDPTDHALMLQDNEAALVKHVKQYFDKVIVILNSSHIMEIPELVEDKTADNYGVDAILWIGNPGNNGAAAVGRILTGEVNPSGKTVDLWMKDFKLGPTWTNFGKQSQNVDEHGNPLDANIYDANGNDTGYRTVEYREGIYLGYKYYETLYADANSADKDEAYSNVLYPFGYGLSYTTFDWELSSDIAENAEIKAANETVTMRVKVTNTGDVAGKDVVQLYSNPPYTKGGIEKAAANLVGFAKTSLLQPGESETVTIQVAAQDLASYDWNDANGNDNIGYELEAGTYYLSANRDSHTPVITIEREVKQTILCKTDLVTGEEITNVFTGDYTSTRWSLEDNMISRANGLTQPAPASKEDRTYDEPELTMLDGQEDYEPYMDEASDPYYVAEVPDSWTQATSHESDYSDIEIPLREMASLRYDDPTLENGVVTLATDAGSKKWDEFMNQLTWDELCTLVEKGGGTKEIPSLGLEATSYVDGPQQMSGGTFWPSSPIIAATYNVDLAAEQGRMVGNEAILVGRLGGWAGPAVNIHRNPLSGRNFEYYSEDGVLSGKIAEAVVGAASAKGLICYVKHMFLNDQEQYRNAQGGVLTWATEQTIREIYAKPFEAVAKSGHTIGYMSSFNRIGYSNASTNYALHKLLVRGEWQFKGRSITDAWVKMYNPIDLMVRVGDEQPLGDGAQYPEYGITRGEWDAAAGCVRVPASADEKAAGQNTMLSPTHYYAVRVAAQHILFSTVNSITCKNNLEIDDGTLYFGQYVAGTQMITVPGLDDVKNIAVKEGSVLPAGLSVSADGTSITGAATEIGDYIITVTGTTNNWVEFEADVVIHVVNALEVKNKGVDLENEDADTIRVKAGEAIDLEFYSDYFQYGQRYTLPQGGFPEGVRVENPGFIGTRSGTWQIVNLYQQFEDWNECADTVANPLYRGKIGAVPRTEDSTAGDMPTVDADKAFAKFEYSFFADGTLPVGLTSEATYQTVNGISTGIYDVQKSLKLIGSIATPGEYEVTVTFQIPWAAVQGGWVGKLWMGGVQLAHITRTITIVVE